MEEFLVAMDLGDTSETKAWWWLKTFKVQVESNTTLVTLYAKTPASVKIWMILAGNLYLKPFQSFRILCSRQDCQVPAYRVGSIKEKG
jgi:hypothetical protein